jgi:Zn-dependent M16 (insulinase) family peptidase
MKSDKGYEVLKLKLGNIKNVKVQWHSLSTTMTFYVSNSKRIFELELSDIPYYQLDVFTEAVREAMKQIDKHIQGMKEEIKIDLTAPK